MRAHLHAGSDSYAARYLTPTPLLVTMLRDPCERLVSAYKHILRHRENPLHAELAGGRVSLLECVTNPVYAQFTRNFQTWMVLVALNCHLDPKDLRPPRWPSGAWGWPSG